MERFLLYVHYGEMIEQLDDAKAGRLFKLIFRFVEDGEIPNTDDPEMRTFLKFICRQIEHEGARYKVCGKGKYGA